jgi:hypothetical protein
MVQVNFFGQQKRRCELRWFKCIFLDNKSGAASCALIFWTTDRRFDFFYHKHKSTNGCPKNAGRCPKDASQTIVRLCITPQTGDQRGKQP